MEEKKKIKKENYIFLLGGVLCVLGAFLNIIDIQYSSYLFVAGSVFLIFSQTKQALSMKEEDFRAQRSARLSVTISLFLLAADYFMLTGSNNWIPCLLIYSISLFFLSFKTKKI